MFRQMFTNVAVPAVFAGALLMAGPAWAQHGGGHGGGSHGGSLPGGSSHSGGFHHDGSLPGSVHHGGFHHDGFHDRFRRNFFFAPNFMPRCGPGRFDRFEDRFENRFDGLFFVRP